MEADAIIEMLGLKPLPEEGGFYCSDYKHSVLGMPEQIANCGVQPFSQRQSIHIGAVVSATHSWVQNAAPHATTSP